VQEGYGPYYALDTLQFNLGMYIDRYIIIDFDAFIDIVDVLGGIEITTSYPIYDLTYPDMNYGYDPFRLEAGTYLLDGRDALKFARTRHGDNDFLRGERQMQVIQAIHKKVTQDNMLSTLIRQAPSLYASLSENIFTDMTLEEMLQLARFAMQIPAENITTGSIDDEYNMTYALPTGRNVYIPDREKLIELLTNVFGEGYNS